MRTPHSALLIIGDQASQAMSSPSALRLLGLEVLEAFVVHFSAQFHDVVRIYSWRIDALLEDFLLAIAEGGGNVDERLQENEMLCS